MTPPPPQGEDAAGRSSAAGEAAYGFHRQESGLAAIEAEAKLKSSLEALERREIDARKRIRAAQEPHPLGQEFRDALAQLVVVQQQVEAVQAFASESESQVVQAQATLMHNEEQSHDDVLRIEGLAARLQRVMGDNSRLRREVAEREGKVQALKSQVEGAATQHRQSLGDIRQRKSEQEGRASALEVKVLHLEEEVSWYKQRCTDLQRELGQNSFQYMRRADADGGGDAAFGLPDTALRHDLPD